MGVRFIIIFCLLFVVSHEANGARSVRQQKQQEENAAPYITSYGTREENDAPYILSYGTKEENAAPYITSYRTHYKQGTEEVEAPYITQYGSKEDNKVNKVVEAPYITQYGSKEGHKLEEVVEAPYITQYGSREGHKVEEVVEAPYITQYGSKEGHKVEEVVEALYTTQYNSKEGHKVEEIVEAPYITQYGSKEGHKVDEVVEAPYVTQYGSKEGHKVEKVVEAPYMTQYGSKEGTLESKNVEAPYITGYISAQGAKNCEHDEKHVHPPSQNEAKESPMGHHHKHHDHMHAHSSSPMDHREALKQGFFTFEDFYKGNSLPLNFPKQEHSRFLPKETADSIPFSTSQLPHLLQLFSTPRDSREAKHMAWTLDQCELTPIKGETKFCATSLESMTEFIQKIIGSGISFNILSTTLPETSTAITQKYTILEDPKQVIASKMVFCHPVPYPYAVFFCHHFENDTKFFKVSLRGENGDKVEAVAVCHMDTSDWDPNHGLFRLLGIKAGASSPVCHFFPANHLVWLPSSPTTADS